MFYYSCLEQGNYYLLSGQCRRYTTWNGLNQCLALYGWRVVDKPTGFMIVLDGKSNVEKFCISKKGYLVLGFQEVPMEQFLWIKVLPKLLQEMREMTETDIQEF
jgi:hypothetical protein